MKLSKAYLRSVTGQLQVLAAVFAGALVLAVVTLSLRSALFERFVREKMKPLPEALERDLAQDPTGRRCLDGAPEDTDLIYGAWIERDGLDPGGELARSMFTLKTERALERARVTLVAGSAAQRRRAVEFLSRAEGTEASRRAAELCRHAEARARRRGEEELLHRAESVEARLESSVRPPGSG